ncbi:hypothetical protein OQA88_4455 [Cercophora sp. LCS_1]
MGSLECRRPIKPKGPNDPIWEDIKATVYRVYWDEDRDLKHTMEVVAVHHNFSATKKQWTTKLDIWNYKKNVSSEEMKNIARIQQKRKVGEDKETRFTVRGRPVPLDNIDRWQKRQKLNHGGFVEVSSETEPVTPSDISYETPSEAELTPSQSSAPTPRDGFEDSKMPDDKEAALALMGFSNSHSDEKFSTSNALDMTSMYNTLPKVLGLEDQTTTTPRASSLSLPGRDLTSFPTSRSQTPTQDSYSASMAMELDGNAATLGQGYATQVIEEEDSGSDASSVIEIDRDQMYPSDSESDTDSVITAQEDDYKDAVNNGRSSLLTLPMPGQEMDAALRHAVRAGHLDRARHLLVSGANVDAQSKSGMAPLHIAAFYGRTDIVDLLLKHGADIDAIAEGDFEIRYEIPDRRRLLTVFNARPLHLAFVRGHFNTVDFFLSHSAEREVSKNKWADAYYMGQLGLYDLALCILSFEVEMEESTFDYAMANGHTRAIEIIHNNDELNGYYELEGRLFDAIRTKTFDTARILFDAGVRVWFDQLDWTNRRWDDWRRGLVADILEEDDILRLLLECVSDEDKRRGLDSILLLAIWTCNAPAAQIAFDAGASIGCGDILAAEKELADIPFLCREDCVELILKYADSPAIFDELLLECILMGEEQSAYHFLAAGARVSLELLRKHESGYFLIQIIYIRDAVQLLLKCLSDDFDINQLLLEVVLDPDGSEGTAVVLLEAGAEFGSLDENTRRHIHEHFSEEVWKVRFLLEHATADIDFNTVLWFAILNNHPDTAQLLFEKGYKAQLPDTTQKGAICQLDPACISLLLRSTENHQVGLDRLLLDAALQEGAGIAQRLFDAGARILSCPAREVAQAIQKGPLDVVNLLLRYTDGIVGQRSATPNNWLFSALHRGHEDILRLLLKNGADLRILDGSGRNLLDYALSSCPERIPTLLRMGFDVDMVDGSGFTPLIRAIWDGSARDVRLLLENNANPNAKDALMGRFPLRWAVLRGQNEIQGILRAKGAVEWVG